MCFRLPSPSRFAFALFAAILLLPSAGFTGSGDARAGEVDSLFEWNTRLFEEVLSTVESNYYREVSEGELIEAALQGVMSKLDKYSKFLTPEDYRHLLDTTRGRFGGIGVMVTVSNGVPVVTSLFEGAPAMRAGIMKGDRIVQIEGRPTKGWPLKDVISAVRGEPGSEVELTVERYGAEGPLRFRIRREKVELKDVPYCFLFPDGVGYIKLAQFSRGSAAAFEDSLRKLIGLSSRGLVIDLRNNPGGLLDEAVAVADLFTPLGSLIVSTKGAEGKHPDRFFARVPPLWEGSPLVVLTDRSTASGAEIVAGTLRELGLAALLGEATFGKGSVQTIFPLSGGAGVRLTTALYFLPGGVSVGKRPGGEEDGSRTLSGQPAKKPGGIAPDVIVREPRYPKFAERLRRSGLVSSFVRSSSPLLGDGSADEVAERLGGDFSTFLKWEGLEFRPSEFDSSWVWVSKWLAEEIVRARSGGALAARYALEHDPQFLEARRLIERSPSQAHLNRTVSSHPGAGTE